MAAYETIYGILDGQELADLQNVQPDPPVEKPEPTWSLQLLQDIVLRLREPARYNGYVGIARSLSIPVKWVRFVDRVRQDVIAAKLEE